MPIGVIGNHNPNIPDWSGVDPNDFYEPTAQQEAMASYASAGYGIQTGHYIGESPQYAGSASRDQYSQQHEEDAVFESVEHNHNPDLDETMVQPSDPPARWYPNWWNSSQVMYEDMISGYEDMPRHSKYFGRAFVYGLASPFYRLTEGKWYERDRASKWGKMPSVPHKNSRRYVSKQAKRSARTFSARSRWNPSRKRREKRFYVHR